MNKLLVLGNGFDQAAQAPTSYSKFFNSEYYKSKRELAFAFYQKAVRQRLYSIIFPDSLTFNCWDLLFCMISKNNSKQQDRILWCDVEQLIHDTLVGSSAVNFSWQSVFYVMHEYYSDSDEELYLDKLLAGYSTEIITMCYYLDVKYSDWEGAFKNLESFYSKVLDQLQEFEQFFGQYIYEQTNNEDFNQRAQELVVRLLYGTMLPSNKNEDIVYIDSFNYSTYENFTGDIRHLNGDYLHPIFGIDLSEDERKKYPEFHRFTKTSRRLYQDVFQYNRDDDRSFYGVDQAVVFGHSLNRMDYDYFMYLFNILKFNTFDEAQMRSIQFAYKIHDPLKETESKNKLAKSVYSLLNYYEEFVRGKNQNILINMLRWNRKLEIKYI